jgi:hypothetical protein
VNQRRKITRGGVEFFQTVPDEMNPRYVLFKGILAKYYPTGALKEGVPVDSSMGRSERFNIQSEAELVTDPVAKLRLFQDPGTAFIENFIYGYAESGMLTYLETYSALLDVYKEEKVKKIFSNSPMLKHKIGKLI